MEVACKVPLATPEGRRLPRVGPRDMLGQDVTSPPALRSVSHCASPCAAALCVRCRTPVARLREHRLGWPRDRRPERLRAIRGLARGGGGARRGAGGLDAAPRAPAARWPPPRAPRRA